MVSREAKANPRKRDSQVQTDSRAKMAKSPVKAKASRAKANRVKGLLQKRERVRRRTNPAREKVRRRKGKHRVKVRLKGRANNRVRRVMVNQNQLALCFDQEKRDRSRTNPHRMANQIPTANRDKVALKGREQADKVTLPVSSLPAQNLLNNRAERD